MFLPLISALEEEKKETNTTNEEQKQDTKTEDDGLLSDGKSAILIEA